MFFIIYKIFRLIYLTKDLIKFINLYAYFNNEIKLICLIIFQFCLNYYLIDIISMTRLFLLIVDYNRVILRRDSGHHLQQQCNNNNNSTTKFIINNNNSTDYINASYVDVSMPLFYFIFLLYFIYL